MPLYEYRCKKCDAHFERIQKFSDAPLRTCEACGGTLERLLSSPAIQFKGSGWYVTDYARKSSPEASPKSDGSSGDKPASAGASESKKTSEASKATKDKDS